MQITEHCLYAAADCVAHGKEHVVSGTVRDKNQIGIMKNDLVKILREDWPECKLQPKPVYAGYHSYEGDGKHGVWISHITKLVQTK